MSVGEIAALIAAIAFVLLVGLLVVPILKLGRVLDETTIAIRRAHEGAQPLLTNAVTTVEQVNAQLERMDGVTRNATAISSNVAALTSLFAATVGGPGVRIAAFSYGVRKAINARRAADAQRQAKLTRQAARRKPSR